MTDDERGDRLEAMLKDEGMTGVGRFSHYGDGTLLNEHILYEEGGEVNITIRDGEAAVAVIVRDEDGDPQVGAELGEFRWNDAKGIAAVVRHAFPEVFARKNPRRSGTVTVRPYTRRAPRR